MATTRQIIDGLDRFVEGEVRGLAEGATRNLAAATPKRTGWAAANWRPNIGEPLDGPLRPSGHVLSARADQLAAIVDLQHYSLADGSIWITNLSGYAAEIDERTPYAEDAIERTVRGRQAGGLVRGPRRP